MRITNDSDKLTFFDDKELIAQGKRKDYNELVQLKRELNSFEYFTDEELLASKGNPFIFDIEVYPNYFLIAFQDYFTKKIIYFEQYDNVKLNIHKLLWVIHNHCLVGFNSNNFDLPILWLSLQNVSNETLKNVTDFIIKGNWRPNDVEKAYNFKMGQINTIDIMDPSPLRNSLKGYASRLFFMRLQELVYLPETILTLQQMKDVRYYCFNDLGATSTLLTELIPQLELRVQLSKENDIDLRSKSDQQIAEAVIMKNTTELNGYRSKKPKIPPGTVYKYQIPNYINYKTPLLQNMLETIRNSEFIINEKGSPIEPESFEKLKSIQVGHSIFRMGIGGLHSTEECVQHKSDENTILIDRDVNSYYPNLILTLGLYPKHLGSNFLEAYGTIVRQRLYAKARVSEIKKEIDILKSSLT